MVYCVLCTLVNMEGWFWWSRSTPYAVYPAVVGFTIQVTDGKWTEPRINITVHTDTATKRTTHVNARLNSYALG